MFIYIFTSIPVVGSGAIIRDLLKRGATGARFGGFLLRVLEGVFSPGSPKPKLVVVVLFSTKQEFSSPLSETKAVFQQYMESL